MFHTADPKEIKEGKLTDIYFVRTMQVLKAKKIDKWVKAEFIAKRFPEDYGWGVLAGVEEAAYLLKDLKVSVRAMKEGTIFRAFEPVMEIEGMYTDFGLYETSREEGEDVGVEKCSPVLEMFSRQIGSFQKEPRTICSGCGSMLMWWSVQRASHPVCPKQKDSLGPPQTTGHTKICS
jgi:hypothetical protein